MLFRDEASNLAMAGSWGWVFGLIWWYVGPLTLLPLILTGEIDWRISAASILLPSLLGHLIYGACTGSLFYILERAYTNKHMLDPRMNARELRRSPPCRNASACSMVLRPGHGRHYSASVSVDARSCNSGRNQQHATASYTMGAAVRVKLGHRL